MNGRPFRTTRHMANLRQGRNDWYRIENKSSGPSMLHIYDEIGFFGVTAADLVRDLAGVKGDLDVHINCPGGDVFEGIAIYNALHDHHSNVSVSVDGLAASAASFIAMAARPGKLSIAKTGSLMIHDAFSMGLGNAADLRSLADLLDQQSDNIAGIYADRTGQPVEHWRDAMRKESWYVGQEAVNAGLADSLNGGAAVTNNWDLSVFGTIRNADKYNADDRKRMAADGQAMPDGSYPVADAEDLDNAIKAVGRGGAEHDSIRAHIIKRAEALGLSSQIPDNWSSDGSLKGDGGSGQSNHLQWDAETLRNALKEAFK